MPTFIELALVTFLHPSVTRPLPSRSPNVDYFSNYQGMRIIDVTKFYDHSPILEWNRDLRVSGENLPADFTSHKPRISTGARLAPNLEVLVHGRGRIIAFPA